MNARILSSYLVWDDGLVTHTLDGDAIHRTKYQKWQLSIWYASYEWPVVIEGDDAAFFHAWWMQRLEDEEKAEAEWREEERKRREKQAKTTGDEEPA